jgi:hypothetical protein
MYTFTLILSGPNPSDPENLDRLFEAGCDDAVFGTRDGVYTADFEREGETLWEALMSAIGAVENAVPGLEVTRAEPEVLVTASEIAARTGRSRESIRQLFTGMRGSGTFPQPAAWLSDRTRLWNWHEVSAFFESDSDALATAEALEAVNAFLKVRKFASRRSDVSNSRDDLPPEWRRIAQEVANVMRTRVRRPASARGGKPA